ncbi:metal ABC transporter permease [Candidatus Saccharibacteria bacterium]|nr:metal ABC transporter permease [Candidatus Saccharibacteria bacterium]
MNSLVEMFSYSFMVRALVVGVLVAFSSALIGIPLVLKKSSMLGDGLSHVAFGAFAVASVLGFAPIPVAIPIVILASFLVLRLGENSKIYGDAMIALVSVSALAIGVFAVSLAGTNVDINSYLFGSILAVGESEVWLAMLLLLVIVGVYVVFHNKIFVIIFDEKFARAIGINTKFYNVLFAILCSVLIVLGMRLMGALLISSLIVFPALSAQTVFRSFKSVTIASAVLAVLNFVVGLIISYYLVTPTSATVVIVSLGTFIVLKILSRAM